MESIKKIVVASDHRGFELKEYLIHRDPPLQTIKERIVWLDVGAFTNERSDYPHFAHQAIKKLTQDSLDRAILFCGSGNGMAITANRFKGIFACVAWNPVTACQAQEDDNCNVLVIPADYVSQAEMLDIVSAWLNASFKGGRYAERLALIDSY